MSRDPQRFVPYLIYSDAPAALEFLGKAFGFEERYRLPMPDGRLGHAEVVYAGQVLMLASAYPEMGFQGAGELPARHAQVKCYVDDVDAHHARAREAGATIVQEPADQPYGERVYRAVDPEGQHWQFAGIPRGDAGADTPPSG